MAITDTYSGQQNSFKLDSTDSLYLRVIIVKFDKAVLIFQLIITIEPSAS